MNLPTYARAAARLLREAKRADHSATDATRLRSVSTIERALAANRRRAWWWRGGVAAAVALLGAVSFVDPVQRTTTLSVASPSSGAAVTDARGTLTLTQPVELSAGSHVATSETGNAVFSFSTGSRLALAKQGRLAVESVGQVQRFRLTGGQLDARVAHLKPGERFVIETIDATVEVRGTAFRVTVLAPDHACESSTRTLVRVSEGVVEVRSKGHAAAVRAGGSWPVRCRSDPPPQARDGNAAPRTIAAEDGLPPKRNAARPRFESAAQRGTPARGSHRNSVAPSQSAGSSEVEAPPRTPLSLQNDAFESAVRAQQRGDWAGALERYRDFIRRFPASPLTQNARVEVMRLLAHTNRTAAAKAAADYLERYPSGFATEEAERLSTPP